MAIAQENLYRHIRGSAEVLAVALDARDSYSQQHSDRVVTLAYSLGITCGLSSSQLAELRIAAHFHDIGKIGVPDAVLLKPSKLTDEEWQMMKSHAAIGERLYRAAETSNTDAIAMLIRHHHESFDGSGYPDGLRGEEIPLACRILLVADAYDAMTSARPYHKARSHEQVMAIMDKESGKKLDPVIFNKFVRMMQQNPEKQQ